MKRAGLLATPYLLGVVLLVAVPLGAAVALAFTEYAGIAPPRFNGLDNFRRLGGDDQLRRALFTSATFVVVAVPLRLLGATGLALLLHRGGTPTRMTRAAAFVPTVIPDLPYALLWLWLLNPLYGPLGGALPWLTDPWAARIAISLMASYQLGEGFVIALAVRRTIPPSLLDAARVDGATAWQRTRRITLPLMAPVLALLALRDVLASLQLSFIPAAIVADGGPGDATTTLPLYLYRSAFEFLRFGYVAAVSVTILIATIAILGVQWLLVRRWWLARAGR